MTTYPLPHIITLLLWIGGALVALSLSACDPPPEAPTHARAHDEAKDLRQEPSRVHTPDRDDCSPLKQLATMDSRRPVPLQPMMAWHQKQNMMEHLVAIQRITDALSHEDWEGVASASALIESSPQMQHMCQHMGAGADGFTELALEFHRRADAIGVAAKQQDGAAVLRATAHTLQACTSCHATYRQDVVDASTWQERTGSSVDPAAMHHGATGD